MISADGVSDVISSLIINKYATLKELKIDYDIDEVLEMYDILVCSKTNEIIIMGGE